MPTMTRGEREELARVLRQRARLSAKMVEQHAAKLRADVEAQLSRTYSVDDAAWGDLTAAAEASVRKADKELARRCAEIGIRPEFRPRLQVSWWKRGENAFSERHDELRRAAQTRITEMAKAAVVQIEAKTLEGLELLAADALESDEAKTFLAAMPTVDALMPRFDVEALPEPRTKANGAD